MRCTMHGAGREERQTEESGSVSGGTEGTTNMGDLWSSSVSELGFGMESGACQLSAELEKKKN